MSLTIGSTGDQVRELQSKLAEFGFDPGPIDGIFGACTRKAVAAFQTSKNLEADGIVGPITLKALGIEINVQRIEKERSQFRSLILKNPNYFGNLKKSKYKPVKSIKNKTSYEELKCVGYDPHLEQLEAVVYVKLNYGYGGGICSDGTPEYVRFFMDWNNDGTWENVGMSRFRAYDIPGKKPLEYSLTLNIDPKNKFCNYPFLPKVRAILSWNNPPPDDDPEFVPIWGNILDARIQIAPKILSKVGDIVVMAGVDLQQTVLSNFDPDTVIPHKPPHALSLAELNELYKDTSVPAQRFSFPSVQPLLTAHTINVASADFPSIYEQLGLNISDIIDVLINTDGDITFEELNCIGYNPERKHLSGTLTVKSPCGYLGNLCNKGSTEYVAFWEWDETALSWNYLGTTAVDVHDIPGVPSEGLKYAVSLPVDFSHHMKPCADGPAEVRIRAILSWGFAPPATNPHWVPTFGNREETLIHIKPSIGADGPYIETVGNMDVCDIDQTTGLADGIGIVAYFSADRSPFGKWVTVTGIITNPPVDILENPFAIPMKYKISVRPYDAVSPEPWQIVDNQFTVSVSERDGFNPPVHKKVLQKVDTDGFYTYLEDPGGPKQRHYLIPVLARWNTGSENGLWQIRIDAKKPDDTIVPGGIIVCAADGSTRSTVKLYLDNDDPVAQIALTGVQPGGTGDVEPAEKCGKFKVGDIIHGTYSVSDKHFGRLTLHVIPADVAHGATVNPPSRSFDIVPTTGESGDWSLDTSGMEPCGYVVRLWSRDRTIVNSGYIGLRDTSDVGFCLEAVETEA